MKFSNFTVIKILEKFPEYVKVVYNGKIVFDETENLSSINNIDLIKNKQVSNFSVNIIDCHHYIINMFGE